MSAWHVYGVGFQYEEVPQLMLCLFYLFVNLLFLPGINITAYKKKKSRNTMTFKITHVSVRHSHVKWHSPSLLSKMLLVPASDSPSDFQLEEMAFCLLCLLWWS